MIVPLISGISVSVYWMLFSCILLVRLFLAKTTSHAREARHTIPKIWKQHSMNSHGKPWDQLFISLYISLSLSHVLACLPQHICPGSSRSNVQRSASLRQNSNWPVGPQPGRGVSQKKTSSSTNGVNLESAAGVCLYVYMSVGMYVCTYVFM